MIHGDRFGASNSSAPRSQSYAGLYGRLFRGLPPHEPPGQTLKQRLDALGELADRMVRPPRERNVDDNLYVPAAYTYLLQFLAHDIGFDVRGLGERETDPDYLRNFRTPRLDLDNVYGPGPRMAPHLYDSQGHGQNNGLVFRLGRRSGSRERDDLPRLGGKPLLADPRNASNYIVSQLHLAVMKFHNGAMKHLADRGLEGLPAFEQARQQTRWHYQWIVVHDLLKRVVRWPRYVEPHVKGTRPDTLYTWRNSPYLPVEFAVAAFRFGHSMVRSEYALDAGDPVSLADLLSCRRSLPEISWRRLTGGGSEPVQYAGLIRPLLTSALARLPRQFDGGSGGLKSLAHRDLRRGWELRLPAGQDVARAIGERVPGSSSDPLWFYVLNEDEYGGKLGAVGSRIVVDVLMGLLWGDPSSYMRRDHWWRPVFGATGVQYALANFLEFAGMRMHDNG